MSNHLFWLQDVDYDNPKAFGRVASEKAKLQAVAFPIKPAFVVTKDFLTDFSKADLLSFYTTLTTPKNPPTKGFKKLLVPLLEPQVRITDSTSGKIYLPHPGFANFTHALKDIFKETESSLLVELVTGSFEELVISSGDPIEIKTASALYTTSKASPQLIDLESVSGKKTPRSALNHLLTIFFDLEKFYFFPISVHFTLEGAEAFITKVVPMTLATSVQENFVYPEPTKHKNISQTFFVGLPIAPGLKAGTAKIINSPRDFKKVKFGDIVIAKETSLEFLPILKKCSGLVTESQTQHTHAATFAKHRGIPCVIGIPDLTLKFRDHQVVKLNGKTGEVWL